MALQSHRVMRYIAAMQLFVNGEQKTCVGPTTLAEFIERLGMKGDRVAVELNREIVRRAQWADTLLHDGDRLEVVHFVGGGAGSC
jgi:thiamine biosynthesis protein ThiS